MVVQFSSYFQKVSKEYKKNRGNAFCLGSFNCIGCLFLVSEMVDKVAATVFCDVEVEHS